jgi:hypothetical protein
MHYCIYFQFLLTGSEFVKADDCVRLMLRRGEFQCAAQLDF